jgi:hypothetical protein
MTTPVCRVSSCDRPVTDAWVCQHCAHDLDLALGDIPAVVHQLNLTLAKQTSYGEQPAGTGPPQPTHPTDRPELGAAEHPLPMDPRASAAASELRHHLCNWVTIVAETRGLPLPAAAIYHPGGEPGMDTLARWLLHHVEWLRHHEHGHVAVEELTGDMRTARRVIDVPANRTTFPVGPCPEAAVIPSGGSFTITTTITYGADEGSRQTTSTGLHCLGEVRAYIPNTDTQPARLECSACHTVWESWQWLRAGRRIKDRETAMKGTAA